MLRVIVGAALAVAACAAGFAQDAKPDDRKKIEFKFKNTSARAVIDYVAKMTGHIVIYEAKPEVSIDAYSEVEIEAGKAWDFVNSALAPKNFATVRQGNLVKVVTIDDAKKLNWIIRVGADPEQVEANDTVITQIVPLKHINVNDFEKNLKSLFPKGSDTAKDEHNNAFIVNAKSNDIKRFLTVLKLIDVPGLNSIKVKIIELKNSGAGDMKKILDEMFKKEQQTQQNPFGGGGWWQFFAGGRGERGGDSGAQAGKKSLASDTIKIISDERTNSLIIAATEENIRMIEEIVGQLDSKSIGVSQLKLFRLRYANAKEVADNLTNLFKAPESPQQQMMRQRAMWQWWDPAAQAMLEGAGAQQGVRALADTRTNTVLVVATENQMKLVTQIMEELDREMTELLKIKILPLKNAEATALAQTLNQLFQKQTAAAAQSGVGPNVPPWARMIFGQAGGGRQPQNQVQATAADIIRIVPDVRTNSVIVTAIEENLRMVEELVRQLDSDLIDAIKFKTYPLRYADASEVAAKVQSVLGEEQASSRGQVPGGTQNMTPQQRNFLQQLMRQQGSQETGVQPISMKVIADSRTNSVIVAATDQQLKIVDQLILELDRQVTEFLKIKIYPLKNAKASEMSTLIANTFRSTGGTRQSPVLTRTVEVTTDTRTNTLIVKANEENLQLIDELVKTLDQKPTESETTVIYRPKNISALAIMQAIQGLEKGGVVPQQRTGGTNLPRNAQQNAQQQGQQGFNFGSSQPPARGQQPGNIRRLGAQDQETPGQEPPAQEEPLPPGPQQQPPLTGKVDVQADEDTNILIVRTSPQNLAAIQRIIEEMDKFRPQVLIRVLIAEVTLDKRTEFGVEGFWSNKFSTGEPDARQRFSTDFDMASSGFTYLLTGDEFEAKLRAFAEEGKLRVLATPRVLVLDNQTANITVGKLVPFITQSNQTANGNIINTVQYQQIGIILRVTPHVNPDGLVTMIVHPEVSDLASESESVVIQQGVTARTFNQNAADTTVAVKHGSTVILGGLIREFEDNAERKIPILGDIPILGHLFGTTVKDKRRRELMIFITPHVVFNQQELEELTEIEKGKLRLIDPRDIEQKGREWIRGIKR